MISGCLRGIGCTVGILLVSLGAWMTRDAWLPVVRGGDAPVVWQRVDTASLATVEAQVRSLSRDKGPVFVTVSAAELGALLLNQAGSTFANQVQNAEVTTDGDAIVVRGRVDPSAFRGLDGIGGIIGKLSGPQRIAIKGVPSVRSAGAGILRVDQVKVGEVIIPKALYPTLVERLTGQSQAGADASFLPFPLPRYIGDVRVSAGRVTLYKTTP